jgi:hypothetical protein
VAALQLALTTASSSAPPSQLFEGTTAAIATLHVQASRVQNILSHVSTVLDPSSIGSRVEREEPKHVYKVQRPVYYISKVFPGYKTCYNQVQKLLYAILIMKHKLLHYFKSPRSAWLRHTGLEKLSGTASPREGLPSGLSNSWGLT